MSVTVKKQHLCGYHCQSCGWFNIEAGEIEARADMQAEADELVRRLFQNINGVEIIEANLKYKYGNRHFWCRGYFVDTVGRNRTAIQKYIQEQVTEDQVCEQISMKEYIDPFTGETERGGKGKPRVGKNAK